MYCEKCGTKLKEDEIFCTKCGSKYTERPVQDERPIMKEEKIKPRKSKDSKSNNWAILAIVLFFIVIVLAVTIIFLLYFKNTKLSNESSSLSETKIDLHKNIPTSQDRVETRKKQDSKPVSDMFTEPKDESEPKEEPVEERAEEPELLEEYILPYSDEFYIDDVDLRYLTQEEIRIARNEIFARHGRMFQSQDLQEYFDSKSWYVPLIPADKFNDDILSEVERYNANFIKEYEEKYFK